MELLIFKTLWGQLEPNSASSLETACRLAVADGFDGVEGPIPVAPGLGRHLAELLEEAGLHYVAEICTAGSYVPDRRAGVEQHLADLAAKLEFLGPLRPVLVNCIGGCDRWSLDDSLRFFRGALTLAERAGVAISFETHRGRSLYSPWVTARLLETMPLPLTCDFSHWCVVCEGLGDSEDELMREIARHARHIHGRVGYDQGPQVADPRSFLYADDLHRHLRWWRWIWEAQAGEGGKLATFTPEFGPDGYQMRDPASGEAAGDLNEINRWMAATARGEFQAFSTDRKAAGNRRANTMRTIP